MHLPEKSLDPRVNRLPKVGQPGQIKPMARLDQLGTFEVFVQPREGKPFQHEGIVHAPDREMAFVLAKEAFTRRFLCTSLYVADTRSIFVSPMAEGDGNAWDLIPPAIPHDDVKKERYEIFQLLKRGRQHIHLGTVESKGPAEAMAMARQQLQIQKAMNVWAVPTADIRFTSEEEKDLWVTLPEKKFRDASDYKGGEKLKTFLENRE
jgi:ring-1,2-phenylacetyl-CoA epoxidase subunit PaaB